MNLLKNSIEFLLEIQVDQNPQETPEFTAEKADASFTNNDQHQQTLKGEESNELNSISNAQAENGSLSDITRKDLS